MEGLSSVISGDDVENNVPTRPGSSRLSLGSSPSELSEIANLTGSGEHGNVDEDVDFVLGDGEEVLTPIEKLPVEETLFEDTSDTLSNGPVDLEDELQQQQQQAVESTSNVAASTSKMDSELTSHACDQTDDPTTTASYSATTVAETESTVTTTAIMPETRVASSVMIKQEMGEEKKEERIPTEAGNTCIHSATATVTTRNEILYEEGRERTKKEACQQQQQQQLLKDDDGDGEYEKWHKEALDALTKIEIEFARLRDTMYRERMAELNQEALMIAQGTHPDLVAMMERIEMKKNERIRTAETWRRYKRINYQRQLDGLEYQANIDFISGKNALRRTILESLNRKRWNMESERDKLMDTLTDSDRIPDPEVLLLRKRRRTADTRDLQKIAHFVGFPLAPRPEGIPPSSIDEDMVALGLLHAPRSPNQEDDCDVDENKLNRETPSSCESSSALDTYERSIRPCQGHLYYYGRLFKKGEHFTVVDGNGGRYNAKLLTSTDTEAVIQRTDGSKTKLPFIQLSRGIHQLFPKRS